MVVVRRRRTRSSRPRIAIQPTTATTSPHEQRSEPNGRGRRQRRGDGGRRAAFGLDPAGGDRDPAEGGDDGAAEECGAERAAKDRLLWS